MSSQNTVEVDRRAVLKTAAAGVLGAGLVSADEAAAQNKNALKDSGIVTEMVSFKNGDDTINAFLARPKAAGRYGSVILCPGIFGVSDYMKETTAQVAQAGLVGLCVDFYTRVGGAPKTDDFTVLRALVTEKTPDKQIVSDMLAGVAYLKQQGYANRKFGITGFCMGGRISLLTAAASSDILAAAPFYGPVKAGGPTQGSAMEQASKIKGAVQGHYGATDMNPKPDDVRAFYEELKKTNPHGEYFIYEGAGHAFHDFSRPSYNAEASSKAWSRTLEFFREHLK